MKRAMIFLIAAAVPLLAAQTASAEPEPRSLAGKCAKELGAKYDPVRKGWFYDGPNHQAVIGACVARKSKATGKVPEPRTLAGKCAKELGAKYDGARGGWFYDGPDHEAVVAACVARKRKALQ